MGRAYFITATNTGVGKTFFSYLLAKFLKRRKFKVGYWKPIETGAEPYPLDAQLMAELLNLPLKEVVSYTFKLPLAPYIAQKYENKAINRKFLKEEFLKKLEKYDILIVEGAGGLAVPIDAPNYTYAHLAKELDIPTIIVGRAGLGTINDCFLTSFYGKSLGLKILGFVLNGYTSIEKDFSQKDNAAVIEEMTGLKVFLQIPRFFEKNEKAIEEFLENSKVNIEKLLGF